MSRNMADKTLLAQRAGVVDVRTNMLGLLLINTLVMTGKGGVFQMACVAVVCGLLLQQRRWRAAAILAFCIGALVMLPVIATLDGMPASVTMLLTALMFTRPYLIAGFMGYYFICATSPSLLIAGMNRLRVPQMVIIPLAVMLRFFPVIWEEQQAIRGAMRMRGLPGRGRRSAASLAYAGVHFDPAYRCGHTIRRSDVCFCAEPWLGQSRYAVFDCAAEIRRSGSVVVSFVRRAGGAVFLLRKCMVDGIVLNQVSITFPTSASPALDKVSLSIDRGECVLLIGQCGCGKSSLLNLINGIVPHVIPAEITGRISIDGSVPMQEKLWQLGRKVATVYQNPRRQFFCADPLGELAFGSEHAGQDPDGILARAAGVAEHLGITHLLTRNMFALSVGELQRIAIGAGLMGPAFFFAAG